MIERKIESCIANVDVIRIDDIGSRHGMYIVLNVGVTNDKRVNTKVYRLRLLIRRRESIDDKLVVRSGFGSRPVEVGMCTKKLCSRYVDITIGDETEQIDGCRHASHLEKRFLLLILDVDIVEDDVVEEPKVYATNFDPCG